MLSTGIGAAGSVANREEATIDHAGGRIARTRFKVGEWLMPGGSDAPRHKTAGQVSPTRKTLVRACRSMLANASRRLGGPPAHPNKGSYRGTQKPIPGCAAVTLVSSIAELVICVAKIPLEIRRIVGMTTLV